LVQLETDGLGEPPLLLVEGVEVIRRQSFRHFAYALTQIKDLIVRSPAPCTERKERGTPPKRNGSADVAFHDA
jgi:hypothetical protein